jgi:hypothetical protein
MSNIVFNQKAQGGWDVHPCHQKTELVRATAQILNLL